MGINLVGLLSEYTRQRLDALAARITSKSAPPFGMPGIALFAEDSAGQQVQVFRGEDAWGMPVTSASTACLASVGKPAIALLVLELVDEGRLSLDDTLEHAAQCDWGGVRHATIGDMLSHRAGIPPILREEDVPYSSSLTADSIRAAYRGLDLRPARTRHVQYSDVAYGMLADVVVQHREAPLSACLDRLNTRLGTRLTFGCKPQHEYLQVTGVPSPHADSAIAPLNSEFWHALSLPWAAICGAIDDGMRIVRAFAAGSPVLSARIQQAAILDPDAGLLSGGIAATNGQLGIAANPTLEWERCPWGLGVELRGEKAPHWSPKEASAVSFGHVGISGTLAWHDPIHGVTWGMTGTRSSHSGWLLRYGPMLGKAVIESLTTHRT